MLGSVLPAFGNRVLTGGRGSKLTDSKVLLETTGMDSSQLSLVGVDPAAETMRQYVVRRAGEVKQYQRVADETGVGLSWLQKLARGAIPNPNYNDLETLFLYYKRLELLERQQPATAAQAEA
jgi:hypothetical protein